MLGSVELLLLINVACHMLSLCQLIYVVAS